MYIFRIENCKQSKAKERNKQRKKKKGMKSKENVALWSIAERWKFYFMVSAYVSWDQVVYFSSGVVVVVVVVNELNREFKFLNRKRSENTEIFNPKLFIDLLNQI